MQRYITGKSQEWTNLDITDRMSDRHVEKQRHRKTETDGESLK